MIVYAVDHLTKIYPGGKTPANDDLCLQIEAGEIFGLLGDNGAGKSTLVLQMADLLASTSGQIRFMGQPLGQDPLTIPRQVGYMPQAATAINNLTVGEVLYFTAHLRGLSRNDAQLERQRLLQLWEIEHLAHKTGPRLSGGERRLMLLAVAMAGSPPVLLLDEPTNDLDPQRRKQVWDILRRQNHEQGTTIIFITHDAIEAEKVIQRVGILHRGRLVAMGRPAELKQQIDKKLRLELFFSPDVLPCLPHDLQPQPVAPGRWLVYLDRQQAAAVLQQLDLALIDDFRLYSATLEDLYLHYVTHAAARPL